MNINTSYISSSEYDDSEDDEEENEESEEEEVDEENYDSGYSTTKNHSTILTDDNTSDDKGAELFNEDSVNMSDINKHFNDINMDNEKNIFSKEISLLCKEAINKPQFMSHKILEMKSFRLSLNYTDLDVLVGIFPIIWEYINQLPFDKESWIENFDNAKLDMLFSSFLLEDQCYYETLYDLILDYSKKQYLTSNIKNNIFGSDKLCNAFEYIYHSDIFEFNYFNE